MGACVHIQTAPLIRISRSATTIPGMARKVGRSGITTTRNTCGEGVEVQDSDLLESGRGVFAGRTLVGGRLGPAFPVIKKGLIGTADFLAHSEVGRRAPPPVSPMRGGGRVAAACARPSDHNHDASGKFSRLTFILVFGMNPVRRTHHWSEAR